MKKILVFILFAIACTGLQAQTFKTEKLKTNEVAGLDSVKVTFTDPIKVDTIYLNGDTLVRAYVSEDGDTLIIANNDTLTFSQYLTTETDPIWTSEKSNYYTSTQVDNLPVSTFANDVPYLTSYTETDPVYSASSWFSTTNNAAEWDAAYDSILPQRQDINSNTAAIANNSAGISSNLTLISTNAGDIDVLQDTAIAHNNRLLAIESGAVYTETDPIYSADSGKIVWFSDIKVLRDSVADNADDITSNLALINSNTSNISSNLTLINSNTADISDNSDSITAHRTDINSLMNAGYLTEETDPIWNTDKTNYYTSAQVDDLPVSTFSNDVPYLTSYTETDPVYSADSAKIVWFADIVNLRDSVSDNAEDITSNLALINSNSAGISSNLVLINSNTTDVAALYDTAAKHLDTLQAHNNRLKAIEGGAVYTETDPVYTSSSWYTTTNNSSNWNAAYSWGNHAIQGYLKQTDLQGVRDSINTNITNIASNTADINSNYLLINNNENDISSNYLLIAANDADIASNYAEIANNQNDIASNFSLININATDIGVLEDTAAAHNNRLLSLESGAVFTETDPIWISDSATYAAKSWVQALPVSTFSNDAGYLTSFTETDPIWNTDKTNYYTSAQVDDLPVSTFSNDVPYLTSYNETDPIWISDSATYAAKSWVQAQGYLTGYTETDPLFNASAAAGITAGDITNWNTAYGWGNHASAGYLTSYTETDPEFLASPAAGITNTDITTWNNCDTWIDVMVNTYGLNPAAIGNWNTAFGWGNHASAGYLTSYTETDPIFGVSVASAITAQDTARWGSGGTFTESDPIWTTDKVNYYTSAQVDNLPISTFTNDAGYLTSYTETDPVYTSSSWYTTTNNSANWNTAYSWGDHSTAGYLTAESDPVYLAQKSTLQLKTDTSDYDATRSWVKSQGYITGYSETDPIWTADKPDYYTASQINALPVSTFSNDAGYLTAETDPVFSSSAAAGITAGDISDWDEAYGWGNHASAGYLTSFTETDPVFIASPAHGITTPDIANWDEAYGWGDHSAAGYLTSYSETDPTVPAHVKGITSTNISNWNTAYSWGNHASAGYLTSYTETDPIYSAAPAAGITTPDIANWNAAYGWGDHATAGYLTSNLGDHTKLYWNSETGNYIQGFDNDAADYTIRIHADNEVKLETPYTYLSGDLEVDDDAIINGKLQVYDETRLTLTSSSVCDNIVTSIGGTLYTATKADVNYWTKGYGTETMIYEGDALLWNGNLTASSVVADQVDIGAQFPYGKDLNVQGDAYITESAQISSILISSGLIQGTTADQDLELDAKGNGDINLDDDTNILGGLNTSSYRTRNYRWITGDLNTSTSVPNSSDEYIFFEKLGENKTITLADQTSDMDGRTIKLINKDANFNISLSGSLTEASNYSLPAGYTIELLWRHSDNEWKVVIKGTN